MMVIITSYRPHASDHMKISCSTYVANAFDIFLALRNEKQLKQMCMIDDNGFFINIRKGEQLLPIKEGESSLFCYDENGESITKEEYDQRVDEKYNDRVLRLKSGRRP